MEATALSPNLSLDTSTAPSDAEKLVDRIIYLASLASKRDDVDPMLETLREVTSTWDRTQSITGEKHAQLEELEQKLKQYLINDDPVRAFNSESLAKRLADQVAGTTDTNSDSNVRSFWFVLGGSVLAAAIGFVAPPQPFSLSNLTLFSIPLFFTALHIGISWFYLTALRNFKSEVRRAFVVICIGILLFAVAFSHYALISAFGLTEHPLLRYGGVTWLVSAPLITIFYGLVLYARQVGVKSSLLRWPVVLGIFVASTVVVVVLPHAPVTDEFLFDFWTTGAVMVLVFGTLGFWLSRKVAKVLTTAYAIPMRWLSRYMFVLGPTTIGACAAIFVIGELHGTALFVVIAACGVLPQPLLLYTGYSFKKETSK